MQFLLFLFFMERRTGLEPATFSLARRRSTTELPPLITTELYQNTVFLKGFSRRNYQLPPPPPPPPPPENPPPELPLLNPLEEELLVIPRFEFNTSTSKSAN